MLAAFEKEHRSQPLKVIGIEAQGSPEEAIKTLVQSKGVGYSIVKTGNYSKKQFKGIPHVFVFDWTGKEIFEGKPAEAEAAAVKALKSAPALWLGEASFDKLKALAAQVEKKDKLGPAAVAVRAKLASTDAAEKTEAETLLKVLEGYSAQVKASAAAQREENADLYLSTLDALAKEFAGDALGAEAKALCDKEKADPEFQKLRKGLKEVADQRKALESLPCCKGCKGKSMKSASLACDACKQANADAIAAVKKALAGIQKKYEGSIVATKASELASSL